MDRPRRAATALAVGLVGGVLAAALLGPPDPVSQLRTAAAVFVAAAPLAYYAIGELD